jgi:glucose/arabinose dehydrogenase
MVRIHVPVILAVCAVAAMSCSKKPPSQQPPASGGEERISGSERIGWDQQAADATELASFRYAIYVDGNRSELSGVSCAAAQTAFACSGRLPTMAPGSHTLEVTSFIVDSGSVLESGKSTPLRVVVGVLSAGVSGVSGTFDDVDMRGGGGLLALVAAPDGARSGHVFAIYTTTGRDGGLTFRLARFRDVNGTLGERAILLDDVPASPVLPRAALTFGPDGKLYAAFDDGGDPRTRLDAASYNGKVVRLNVDGSRPRDQPSAIYADGVRSPLRLDWSTDGALWIADSRDDGSARLMRIGS